MNMFNDSSLIVTAPPEILFGLAIYFCLVGMTLFTLAVEAGNYPRLQRRIRGAADRCVSLAGGQRRRWFAPVPGGTVAGGG